MMLKDCSPDAIVSFPGKRRKYRVRDHGKPYLEMLDKVVDGKNFKEHAGTHLYNSSGRIIHVRSDREIIKH